MKLLIVDDNPIMRKLIRSMVTDVNDTVSELDDGEKVVQMYTDATPDFVLMDIGMPKVNGIMATENLKKEFPDARVIIVTNYSGKEIHDAAEEAGVEKYFMKDDITEVKKYLISEMKKI